MQVVTTSWVWLMGPRQNQHWLAIGEILPHSIRNHNLQDMMFYVLNHCRSLVWKNSWPYKNPRVSTGQNLSLVTITEVLSTLPWPGYLVLTMNKAERVILNLDSLAYDDHPTSHTIKICPELIQCKCCCLVQHPPPHVCLYPIVPSTMMITSLVWTWPKSAPHQLIVNIVV
jgi:hypothetical protein